MEAAVRLSVRYINDRYLPDKAIDLLDEAAAKKRLSGDSFVLSAGSKDMSLRMLGRQLEDALVAENFAEAKKIQREIQTVYEGILGPDFEERIRVLTKK